MSIDVRSKVIITTTLTFASSVSGNFTSNGQMLIIGTLVFSGIEYNSGSHGITLGNYLFAGGSADTNIAWK